MKEVCCAFWLARCFTLQSRDLLRNQIGRPCSSESAGGGQPGAKVSLHQVPSATVIVMVPTLRWGRLGGVTPRCAQAMLVEGKESWKTEGQICPGQVCLGSTEMLTVAGPRGWGCGLWGVGWRTEHAEGACRGRQDTERKNTGK